VADEAGCKVDITDKVITLTGERSIIGRTLVVRALFYNIYTHLALCYDKYNSLCTGKQLVWGVATASRALTIGLTIGMFGLLTSSFEKACCHSHCPQYG
jgi:hypothetical protein